MAKPRVYIVVISKPEGRLTEMQLRGFSAALGQSKWPITSWDKGSIAAVQWNSNARELADRVKAALGPNECTISVMQLGPDLMQIGWRAQNDTFQRLMWLLRQGDENSPEA